MPPGQLKEVFIFHKNKASQQGVLEDHIKPINHVLEHYVDQWKRGLLFCLLLRIEIPAGPSPPLLLYSIITRAGGRGGGRPHWAPPSEIWECLAFVGGWGE